MVWSWRARSLWPQLIELIHHKLYTPRMEFYIKYQIPDTLNEPQVAFREIIGFVSKIFFFTNWVSAARWYVLRFVSMVLILFYLPPPPSSFLFYHIHFELYLIFFILCIYIDILTIKQLLITNIRIFFEIVFFNRIKLIKNHCPMSQFNLYFDYIELIYLVNTMWVLQMISKLSCTIFTRTIIRNRLFKTVIKRDRLILASI